MKRLLTSTIGCLACVAMAPVAEAQMVRVGPFGGVSVRAPFVSVDTLPFGGGTRVRAPFVSVNTRGFAYGYGYGYRPYGPVFYDPVVPVYRVPVYTPPLYPDVVYPVPSPNIPVPNIPVPNIPILNIPEPLHTKLLGRHFRWTIRSLHLVPYRIVCERRRYS